jgi:sporulation protein YlmC with PRC-barrel domain
MQSEFRAWPLVAALALMPALMAQTKMPSKAEPMTGTFLSVQASNQWLSTQLIGLSVYDSANENIGKIGDLVIDQSGAIQAVVVGVGGFLGVGAKDIAISLNKMEIVRDRTSSKAIVKLSKPEIELAPSFQEYTGKAVTPLQPTSAKPQ